MNDLHARGIISKDRLLQEWATDKNCKPNLKISNFKTTEKYVFIVNCIITFYSFFIVVFDFQFCCLRTRNGFLNQRMETLLSCGHQFKTLLFSLIFCIQLLNTVVNIQLYFLLIDKHVVVFTIRVRNLI